MQITIPNVPDTLTYSVVAGIAIPIVTTLVVVAAGGALLGLIPLVIAGATYWFIYRNIAIDTGKARLAAAIIAIVHAFFALVSIASHLSLIFLLDAAAAGCVGYAFLRLKGTAQGVAGKP